MTQPRILRDTTSPFPRETGLCHRRRCRRARDRLPGVEQTHWPRIGPVSLSQPRRSLSQTEDKRPLILREFGQEIVQAKRLLHGFGRNRAGFRPG